MKRFPHDRQANIEDLDEDYRDISFTLQKYSLRTVRKKLENDEFLFSGYIILYY